MPPLSLQQRLKLAQRRRAQPQPTPVAIKGWNTRDAIDAMDPADAVVLDNFYPDQGGLVLRKGFVAFATGVGTGAVQTLAEYTFGLTRKLIACATGGFYDITAGGAAGAPLASGFQRNWWQTTAFNNRIFFLNGVDAPQVYDGSTVSAVAWTGPTTLANLFFCTAYQNRLYALERGRCGFWYGGSLQINGALTFFDFSMLSERGGSCVAIGTFAYDGGNGVNDYIAFGMDTGEVFIYQGSDPSQASLWSLVGRYRIAPPVSGRSIVRYGGECYLTTIEDHVAMQQVLAALRTGIAPPRTKVCGAVQAAVAANGLADGFQALYYENGRRLMFNIPNIDGSYDQHVYNVTNDAWCRFRGMPAACWSTFKGGLYFGGSASGTVYQADTGFLDYGTQSITGTGQQAWNTQAGPNKKHATAIRPVIQSTGSVAYNFNVGFDYGDINVPVIASTSPGGAPWDTSPWDVTPWAPDSQVTSDWHAIGGDGVAVGWSLVVNARQPVTWLRTDLMLEQGGALP